MEIVKAASVGTPFGSKMRTSSVMPLSSSQRPSQLANSGPGSFTVTTTAGTGKYEPLQYAASFDNATSYVSGESRLASGGLNVHCSYPGSPGGGVGPLAAKVEP